MIHSNNHHIWVTVVALLLLGCKPQTVETAADGPIVKIDYTAGSQWDSDTPYLGLPANMGKVLSATADLSCLVLSEPSPVGTKLPVHIIGVVKVGQGSGIRHIVVAIPADSTRQTIRSYDLDHFATVHSSAKWIIEQYLINYKGMGKSSVIGWENAEYVHQNLIQ